MSNTGNKVDSSKIKDIKEILDRPENQKIRGLIDYGTPNNDPIGELLGTLTTPTTPTTPPINSKIPAK